MEGPERQWASPHDRVKLRALLEATKWRIAACPRWVQSLPNGLAGRRPAIRRQQAENRRAALLANPPAFTHTS